MERRKPLQAKKQLKADPAKTAAWQARSRKAAQTASKPLARSRAPKATKKARNDSPWRAEVERRRGLYCRACGDVTSLEADHIWPRGQGGPSVVENGGFLCGPWSRCSSFDGGCHKAHTEMKLLWRKEWLDDDQIEWLKEVGYVWWDEDGVPQGRGARRFARTGAAPAA
jgi:hypothetical protein